MKMINKTYVLFGALAVSMCLFVGCSSDKTGFESSKSNESKIETAAEGTAAATLEKTAVEVTPAIQENITGEAASAASGSEAEPVTYSIPEDITDYVEPEIKIDKQVLYYDHYLKITALHYDDHYKWEPTKTIGIDNITVPNYDERYIWGPTITLDFDNFSNRKYGISCNQIIVNDYMMNSNNYDISFSTLVEKGEGKGDRLSILASELKKAGIDKIGKIELSFHIFDGDNGKGLYDSEYVTIKTSAYDSMQIVKQDDGSELFNDGGLRIVGKYVEKDELWGTAVVLYMENSTGKDVVIQVDEMSVNGTKVAPGFSSTVCDGKMSIDDIIITQRDLETAGTGSVSDIKLKFHIVEDKTLDIIKDTGDISIPITK